MTELNEWINSLEKDISFIDKTDHYILTYCGISCKISRPTELYDFYMVSSNGEIDYEWYDNINRYCIEDFTTEQKLINRIIKYIEKEKDNPKVDDKYISSIEPDSSLWTKVIESNKSIDDFDMAYYKMKSKLTRLINTSKSMLDDKTNKTDKSITNIFDESVVANIVISEFLDCWSWGKNQSTKIDLIDDNLFSWRIEIENLKTLLYDYDVTFIIELHFNKKLYPNYPPIVKVISPQLCDSLNHRIGNSKMTQLAYWTPTRSAKYIISRIKTILKKWVKMDNTPSIKYKNKNVLDLESYLLKLSGTIDNVVQNDCIDEDENFIKFDIISKMKNTKDKEKGDKKTYWKQGTGYGHAGCSNWNPDEYVKLQAEKDANTEQLIGNIVSYLKKFDNTTDEFAELIDSISQSLLMQHIQLQFKHSSLLEINNRKSLFKLYFSLIEILASHKSIYLFDIKFGESEENLYTTLNSFKIILKNSLHLDGDNEFIKTMYNTLDCVVFPIYDDCIKSKSIDIKNETHTILDSIEKIYATTLTPLMFEYTPILETNYHSVYKSMFDKDNKSGGTWKTCQKRLATELASLSCVGQLPINYESSIFMRVDENSPMIMRMLITGPKDTPYDSGCLIFDMYVDKSYPNKSPYCWFMNHGGKRFNPNLYANGKVCLSLLGTWTAHSESEKWNEHTSSLLQILISIQSQILIDKPYYNEPSYEAHIGNPAWEKISDDYNDNIRLYVLTSAMRDLLKNPKLYPQFEDVIINHFKLKKEYILELCDKWYSEALSINKKTYKSVIAEIKTELEKL